MKLIELDARFMKHISIIEYQHVETLAEADGVMFQCPKCAIGKERGEEDGRHFIVGAHYIICWFRDRVSPEGDGSPGRWTPSGTDLSDLSLVPGNPPMSHSVLLTGPGCGWHGYITNGEAITIP